MVLVLASVSCQFLVAVFVEDLSTLLQVVAFLLLEHSLILEVVAFVVPEANIVAVFAVLVLKRPHCKQMAESKNDFPCPQHGKVAKHVMHVVVRF